MKRRFRRSKKMEMVDLDITSLLDILVILLVFLLKNYNASDLSLDLAKDTRVTESDSRKMTHYAPVVQVNRHQEIWMNNKVIGRLPASETLANLSTMLEEEKKKLPKEEIEAKEGMRINLVFDRETDYSDVEKVMDSSAKVGFTQFKFIVKGNY